LSAAVVVTDEVLAAMVAQGFTSFRQDDGLFDK
jgi:hypothetical protein